MRKRTASLRDMIKQYLEDAINISKTKNTNAVNSFKKGETT